MALSEKNIPTRNDMLQAMPMNNGFMAEAPAIILDEDGNNVNENHNNVTRDFSVLGAGVNTANIQVKLNAKHEQAELKKKKKQDQENIRDSATFATAEMKEMMSFNGHEFSVEAMQETAGEALSDFERLAREKGWDVEQADTIYDALLVLADPDSTDAQRDQAMKSIDKADPEYANDLAKEAQSKDINNDNKIEKTETLTQSNDLDGMLSDNQDSYDNFTRAPTTGTTASFNAGATAGMSSGIEPQVKVAELAPAPF